APGTAPGYRCHRAVAGAEPDRRRAGRRPALRGLPHLRLDRERPRRHAAAPRAPRGRIVHQRPGCRPARRAGVHRMTAGRVAVIGAAARDPGRVVGMHSFNPVHAMKLVEVVTHPQTTSQSVERAVTFAKALGKEPIVVKDSPGFASSRLGLALGLEAMRMLEEGVASAEDIDKAMELGYNHPMGP